VKNLNSSSSSGTSSPLPPGARWLAKLDCDEDCNCIDRNKGFADALGLENADYSNKPPVEGSTGTAFSPFLKEQARKDPKFVSSIEEKISQLVQEIKSKKSHSFPPMKSIQRQIVHELAEVYGCSSVSYDEDPKRNVVVTATKEKSVLPPVSLTAITQREINPRAPMPIPLGRKESELRSASAAEKRMTTLPSWAHVGTNKSAVRPTRPKTPDYWDYWDFDG